MRVGTTRPGRDPTTRRVVPAVRWPPSPLECCWIAVLGRTGRTGRKNRVCRSRSPLRGQPSDTVLTAGGIRTESDSLEKPTECLNAKPTNGSDARKTRSCIAATGALRPPERPGAASQRQRTAWGVSPMNRQHARRKLQRSDSGALTIKKSEYRWLPRAIDMPRTLVASAT